MFVAIEDAKKLGLRKIASMAIVTVIFILVCINGAFTYFGASVSFANILIAACFSVGVQAVIFISLIAFPHVGFLGKIFSSIVYMLGLTLSAGFAYLYIYQTTLSQGDKEVFDTEFVSLVAEYIGEVQKHERAQLENLKVAKGKSQREVEEERERGAKSGKGPGTGPEYHKKFDAFKAIEEDQSRFENNMNKFNVECESILLMLSDNNFSKQKIYISLSKIPPLLQSADAKLVNKDGIKNHMSNVKTPIQGAIDSIRNIDSASWPIIVSMIWAISFDMVSFLLGIVRHFIISNGKGEGGIVDGIRNIPHSLINMKRSWHRMREQWNDIPHSEKMRYEQEKEARANEEQLDEGKVKNLVLLLLSSGYVNSDNDRNAINPLQQIIRLIEPINKSDSIGFVGVSFNSVEEDQAIKSTMSVFILHKIFRVDHGLSYYVLNSDNNTLGHQMAIIARLSLTRPEIVEKLLDSIIESFGGQRLLGVRAS